MQAMRWVSMGSAVDDGSIAVVLGLLWRPIASLTGILSVECGGLVV